MECIFVKCQKFILKTFLVQEEFLPAVIDSNAALNSSAERPITSRGGRGLSPVGVACADPAPALNSVWVRRSYSAAGSGAAASLCTRLCSGGSDAAGPESRDRTDLGSEHLDRLLGPGPV